MQSQGVDNSLIIQGRQIGPAELEQVRGLLAGHPDWSRYRLSRELCRGWNWRSLTGQIKDMAARSLLLKLEERGWVALPARRCLSPIVGACRQWVVHDPWKPYFAYAQCQHALGNEHLLRELKFLWEEQQEAWARPMSDWLLALHRRRQKHGEFKERQCKRAWQRDRNVVRRGRYRPPRLAPGQGRSAQSKAAHLLDRLEDFDWNILAFLWDGRVPFTNNQAGQDIRMIKVRQKISGCFRTRRGAQIFCRIRSYLSICRKQGRNLWLALQSAVNGAPFIPSSTSRWTLRPDQLQSFTFGFLAF